MKNKKIFMLIGKSGTGKDTIAKEICKSLGLEFALSFTTRPKREGETNLVEYEFISHNDFKQKQLNNEIAEYVKYNVINDKGDPDEWFYGLSMHQLTKSKYILAIVNPKGKEVLEEIPSIKDNLVSILVDIPSDKDRILRILDRENITNEKFLEICRRALADNKDFKDIMCDYIVYNDSTLEDSVQQLKNIIIEEMSEGEI